LFAKCLEGWLWMLLFIVSIVNFVDALGPNLAAKASMTLLQLVVIGECYHR
jgi:hypothetical protein